MSLKNNSFFARTVCASLVFFGFASSSVLAQVPTQTGKTISIASANETAGSTGTMESLRSYTKGETKTVKVVAHTPIPFGTVSNVLLDMKGYDQEFTRSFTFTNSSSESYTINSVDFENKNSKMDFVSIGPDASLPLDVAPGQTFTIKVSFHSVERNKLYSDRLVFATEQAKTPIVYPIQALQQPMSDMPWNKKDIVSSTK